MKKLIFILMVGGLLAQEESQIIKNKYQITASTTLENLAIDKKSEQKFIGGVIIFCGCVGIIVFYVSLFI